MTNSAVEQRVEPYPHDAVVGFLDACLREGGMTRSFGVRWDRNDMRCWVRGDPWTDEEADIWRRAQELAVERFGYWCEGERLPCRWCWENDAGQACAEGRCANEGEEGGGSV